MVYRTVQVELGSDGVASMMVCYEMVNTCGIHKKFLTCTEAHPWFTGISAFLIPALIDQRCPDEWSLKL